jgi:hypothetical protein
MSGYYVSQRVLNYDNGATVYHMGFARNDGSLAGNAGTVTELPNGRGIWLRNEHNEPVQVGSIRERAMRVAVVKYLVASGSMTHWDGEAR